MSEMNVRSDAVDVEQIMRQIRARIREKRGADYTEAELQQLATVKLEKFLDPKGLRSDLVPQFRQNTRGPPSAAQLRIRARHAVRNTPRPVARSSRNLLQAAPEALLQPGSDHLGAAHPGAVNTQAEQRLRRVEEREPLSFELLHNLTLEITRSGHRGPQPQDARRVPVEPRGLRRAAREGARERRAVPRAERLRPSAPRPPAELRRRPSRRRGQRRRPGRRRVRPRAATARHRRAQGAGGEAAAASVAAAGAGDAGGRAERWPTPRARRGPQAGAARRATATADAAGRRRPGDDGPDAADAGEQ